MLPIVPAPTAAAVAAPPGVVAGVVRVVPPRRLPDELSLGQARRIALRAQGLDRPRRDGASGMRALQQVIDRLGLLQIDSVNVLARAHLMPVFSRAGPYDVGLLDRAAGRSPRRLVEAWAHEASLVPPASYRLLGWRQRAYRDGAWGMLAEVPLQHARVLADVRGLIAERGPVTAREVQVELEAVHPRAVGGSWWNWSVAKRVLEFLFFTGEVTAARRNPAFERCYDLIERVLPASVLAQPEPADADAVRALVEIGARAHGIGTVECFADYFRIKTSPARTAVAELVEAGVLAPVRVRGWERRPVYVHKDATLPRRATGRALLSPFDPLVFERRRLEELFGLRYRIEIYTPAHQRVHGYYVLPFLLGDQIAARVDLKADRAAGRLLVQAAHLEPGAPAVTTVELADELYLMTDWLGLDEVAVSGGAHGDLVTALDDALRAGAA